MADVISTIAATSSPTTPDFSDPQAWFDASPSNLVTADERHIGRCLDQGTFTAPLHMSSRTTDATRNFILEADEASGAGFQDQMAGQALFFDATKGIAIDQSTGSNLVQTVRCFVNHTVIRGLQIRKSLSYTSSLLVNATSVLVDSCLIQTGAGDNSRICNVQGSGTKIVNCLLVNAHDTSGLDLNLSGGAYGCTIVKTSAGGGTGQLSAYGGDVVKNCAIFGFATASNGMGSGSGFNATDDDSLPANSANSLTSLTYADQFENSASDYRAKSTGDLQAGTPDSTNTPDDIFGTTRDATTPWIGCFEFAAAGQTADVGVGLVEVSALAPDTDKSAPVPTGLVEVAALSPAATKLAAVGVGLVEVTASSPDTDKSATVGVGLVEVIGVEPSATVESELGVGLVEVSALSPDTDKSATTGVGLVEVSGLSPEPTQTADVGVGLVEVSALAPATSFSAVVGVGLVEVSALAPTVPQSATVGVGLVEVIGIVVNAHVDGGAPVVVCGTLTLDEALGSLTLDAACGQLTVDECCE